jgi:hypothetical protein
MIIILFTTSWNSKLYLLKDLSEVNLSTVYITRYITHFGRIHLSSQKILKSSPRKQVECFFISLPVLYGWPHPILQPSYVNLPVYAMPPASCLWPGWCTRLVCMWTPGGGGGLSMISVKNAYYRRSVHYYTLLSITYCTVKYQIRASSDPPAVFLDTFCQLQGSAIARRHGSAGVDSLHTVEPAPWAGPSLSIHQGDKTKGL